MSTPDDLKKAVERLKVLPEDKEWPAGKKGEEDRREAARPWRETLEQEAGSDETVALLEVIRGKLEKQGKGAWPTPMGALVVGAKETLEVLANENPYSVREYWNRMEEVHMPMHLGLDAEPRPGAVCPVRGGDKDWASKYASKIKPGEYVQDSIANEYIYRVGRAEAFCRALDVTRREFRMVEKETLQDAMKLLALPGGGGPRPELRVTLDLWGFGERVIAELSRQWFAIPDGKYILLGGEPEKLEDEKAHCPSDFVLFSRHVFRPDPDDHVKKQAAVRGEKVMRAAKAAITSRLNQKGPAHPFLAYLRDKDQDIDVVVRRAVGAIDGFVAANWGSFLFVARKWLKETSGTTSNLWRVQREHREDIDDIKAEALKLGDLLDAQEAVPWNDARLSVLEELLADGEPLLEEVIEVLKSDPVPAWLHRFAVDDAKLNGTPIRAGERMIVHLGSAATDANSAGDAADILFGGRYEPRFPRPYLHACPGKELAMGVLLGMLVGLLEQKDVRRESSITVSFAPRGLGAAPSPPMPAVLPKRDDPRTLSVQAHQFWIGAFGFLLPVLVYFVAGVLPVPRLKPWLPLGEVSSYYHTSGVAVFCGMLIAMFGFLYTYRGYDARDETPTNLAGLFALVVACCPTWPPPDLLIVTEDVHPSLKIWRQYSPWAHGTAAVLLFAFLIYMAVRLFRWSDDPTGRPRLRHERTIEKRFRDDLCLIAGLVMSVSIGWLLGEFAEKNAKIIKRAVAGLSLENGPAGAWTALGLLLASGLVSVFWFRSAARKEREADKRDAKTAKQSQDDRVAAGLVAIAFVAGFLGLLLALPWLRKVVTEEYRTLITLVPEVLAIWAFAISWLVKSQTPRVNRWADRFRRLLARIGWRYKFEPT
jgi:hypothetical protein